MFQGERKKRKGDKKDGQEDSGNGACSGDGDYQESVQRSGL